ncbi:MAG TPA: TonB-dependent receptor [Thermoanaerobaculia bacterium]|nr:TonB-dependent receptor [Thermoanaerobaculia bacterium]
MSRSRCASSVLLALAFCVAGAALAQTTGDLDGTVVDQSGAPLPGVTVELRSPQLQGVRSAVTDAAGRYRFPVLAPGVYSVTAQLSGFTKVERSGQKVSLGGTTTIPITMGLSLKEEIVVTSEAPAVDTSKAGIGTNATLESIQRLPLGRNFVSIASTVAGTGTDVSGNITVYGATGLENAYIIDGVNTTGVKTGTQAKQLNNEFVQEVEVKTGGYEAEYGRVLGGTINVVTKSGGNEFKGDAFGYYDSSSLASSDKRTTDRQTANQGEFFSPTRVDAGADLGGYFVKDRLWFFAAYDRVNQDQDYTRTLAVLRDTAQTKLSTQNTDTYRNNLYSGKLTFRLGDSNTIAASVFGDPGTFSGRYDLSQISVMVGADGAWLVDRNVGGSDYSGRWDGLVGTQFLGQAQFGYHTEKRQDSSPFSGSPYLEKQQAGFPLEALPGSGPIFLEDSKFQRYVYKAAGSLFLGAHEVKAGLDWEHLNSDFSESYGGTDRIRTRLTAAGALSNYQHRYFAQTPLVGANCTGRIDPAGPLAFPNCNGYLIAPSVDNNPITDNVGLFAQDSFKVLKNLTVNAGLRYEQQRLKDFTGTTLVSIDNEWSPRIGVVWDFLGNGKSKIYGNYGRFYEVIPQDIQTRALGNEFIIFARNNSSTPDPVDQFLGAPIVQGGELVQSNLKGMYQDELIAGFEFEVAKNWAIGAKGIYRALGRVVEDRCDLAVNPDIAQYFNPASPATCALINPGQGNSLGTIKDPFDTTCYPNGETDAAGNLVAGAPCDSTQPRRYFRGLEVTATHRFSDRFYVLASYLYSKLEGNYSGNLSQTREGGQTDPNINADFDYPGLVTNAFGRLRNDRTHQFKVSGYYAFPFGLTVGANAFYNTGRPYSIRGCASDAVACNAGYSQEGYLVPRGSAGDLPAAYEADLHFEYGLRFGSVSVTPILDVFNVLNRQGVLSREELFNNTGSVAGNDPRSGIGQPGCTAQNASLSNAACASNPTYGKDIGWQNPRVVRLGARVSF